MLKYSKKTGLTLIEILCALNLIAIFSLFIISLQLNNMRLKKYNREKLAYVEVLQAVKEEVFNNLTYAEIMTLKTNNKRYVQNDKLALNQIKSSEISSLFSNSFPETSKTYLVMEVTEGEVLQVEITLHLKLRVHEENVVCTFYKGNYL